MKARRGKLGSIRVERHLDDCGVARASIRNLEDGYKLIGVNQLGLIGAAPKDFVVFEGCGTSERPFAKAYVAKKPVRRHTGFRECVTEYLISRIGNMLPLRVAEGRLVRLERRGDMPPDVRFMSRYFLRPDESLIHGVELVAQCFGIGKVAVESSLPTMNDERAFYTVDFVDDVLADYGVNQDVYERLRDGFARMIAFDALVGATDRHASNWGIIEHVQRQRAPRFAPVFDTARGLLLRQPDDELTRQLETPLKMRTFVDSFSQRVHPLIGIPGKPQLDYFDLVRYMLGKPEKFRKPILSVINAYQPDRVTAMIHKEFRWLFHPHRLRLIDELLRHRHRVLSQICRGC
jgi:hypothetical protein